MNCSFFWLLSIISPVPSESSRSSSKEFPSANILKDTLKAEAGRRRVGDVLDSGGARDRICGESCLCHYDRGLTPGLTEHGLGTKRRFPAPPMMVLGTLAHLTTGEQHFETFFSSPRSNFGCKWLRYVVFLGTST